MHTDGWRGYDPIDWKNLGYIRYKNVHSSNNNQIKRTMKNSNLIEGLWGEVKDL